MITGRTFDTDGGSAYYELDAGFPSAHYLPNARCVVYREIVRTAKVYVRDATTVAPLALILFGGAIAAWKRAAGIRGTPKERFEVLVPLVESKSFPAVPFGTVQSSASP